FFFQAEDGIRDATVTGVQTCALPILLSNVLPSSATQGTIVPTLTLKGSKFASNATVTFGGAAGDITFTPSSVVVSPDGTTITIEIGRASWRDREESGTVAG